MVLCLNGAILNYLKNSVIQRANPKVSGCPLTSGSSDILFSRDSVVALNQLR